MRRDVHANVDFISQTCFSRRTQLQMNCDDELKIFSIVSV